MDFAGSGEEDYHKNAGQHIQFQERRKFVIQKNRTILIPEHPNKIFYILRKGLSEQDCLKKFFSIQKSS